MFLSVLAAFETGLKDRGGLVAVFRGFPTAERAPASASTPAPLDFGEEGFEGSLETLTSFS